MIAILALLACGGGGGAPETPADTGLRGFPDPELLVPPECLSTNCEILRLTSPKNTHVRHLVSDGAGSLWVEAKVSGDLTVGDTIVPYTSTDTNAPVLVRWTRATGEVRAFPLPDGVVLDVALAPGGDLYVLTTTWDAAQPTVGPWLVRFGADGTLRWSVPMEGLDARIVRTDGSGRAWVSGTPNLASAVFSVGDETIEGPEYGARWLGRFDPDGNLLGHAFLGRFDLYDLLVRDEDTVFVQASSTRPAAPSATSRWPASRTSTSCSSAPSRPTASGSGRTC